MRHLCTATLAFTCLVAVAHGQIQLEASLGGGNEVPVNGSLATGFGTFTINQPATTISYTVTTNVTAGTVAHIHGGAVGVAGAIVFPLTGGPTTWFGTTPMLSASQLSSILAEGMYVNVHTAGFPGGEIRGQIVRAEHSHLGGAFSGAAEIPPTPSGGSGVAEVRLDEPSLRIFYQVSAGGLGSPVTAVNLHQGAVGQNGPVIVSLAMTGPSTFASAGPLTLAQVAALKAGGCYVNVVTAGFPGGEIRCQMIKNGGGVPSRGCPINQSSSGGGSVSGSCSLSANSLSIALTHSGAGTLSGVTLTINGASFVLTLGVGSASGSFSLLDAQVSALQQGKTTLTVTTIAPTSTSSGAISCDPYIFGDGDHGSGGIIDQGPHVDNDSGVLGSVCRVQLLGGSPFVPSILFFGPSSGYWSLGATSLPYDLTPGVPTGRLWVDADPALSISAFTDGAGFVSLPVLVPNVPALIGFTIYLQWVMLDPAVPSGLRVSDASRVTFTN